MVEFFFTLRISMAGWLWFRNAEKVNVESSVKWKNQTYTEGERERVPARASKWASGRMEQKIYSNVKIYYLEIEMKKGWHTHI